VKTTPQTSRRVRTAAITLLGTLALAPLTGCQLFSEKLTAEPGPVYPEGVARGEVYDIQVFREVATLRFTNSTPNDFGASTVWLNKRFSHPISGIASGETVAMDLRLFVDQWGETFRAGGFYAQRDPAPVVLVELETGEGEQEVLHGFVIVENIFN